MTEEEKVIEIGNRKYYSQYYVNQLQQENKQLKKHHICVKPYTNDEVREKIDNYKNTIKQLSKINIDKQQRIDKAIEYIQNHQPVFQLNTKKQLEEMYYEFYKNILEILGDKE